MLICKMVLDNSNNEMALFQASSIISRRVPVDFFVFSKEDISQLRDYLFSYCLARPNLAFHTREKILQSIAILFKFSWIRDQDFDVKTFFDRVIDLSFEQIFEKFLVILLIKALLNEFVVNNGTKVGLSYEMHKKCKEQFQEEYLLKIFITTGTILKQCLDKANHGDTVEINFLLAICRLLDSILSWDFDEKDDLFEENKNRSAISYNTNFVKDFPKEWHPYFTSPQLIDILFSLHNRIVASGEDVSSLDNVIISLSGIKKDSFQKEEDRLSYIQKFIGHISEKIHNLDLYNKNTNLIGLVQIIDGFMGNVSLKELDSIPESHKLISQISELILKVIEFPKEQDVDDDTEMYFEDVFEYLLEALAVLVYQLNEDDSFSSFVGGSENKNDGSLAYFLSEFGPVLLNSYVKTKIQSSVDAILRGEAQTDSSLKDWEIYEYQLMQLATLTRNNPENTLRFLYSNLISNFKLAQDQVNAFNLNTNPEDLALTVVYENLKWYIIVSGFILANEGEGETPIIPIPLNNYSSNQNNQPNDLVILLPSLITNILSYFTSSPNDIKFELCSPELNETIFWFFQRWTKSYLFPNKDNYFNLSNNILSVFGTSSHDKAGRLVLDILLDLIHNNFLMWVSKPSPLTMLSNLLFVLCSRQESRLVLNKSTKFIDIVLNLIQHMEVSSQKSNSTIVRSILLVATSTPNLYLQQNLLTALDNRLQCLINNIISIIEHNNEEESKCIDLAVNIIEMLQGYGLACDLTNSIKLFRSYSKYLIYISQFAEKFHLSKDIWSECFNFIINITNRMDMFEFNEEDLDLLNKFLCSIYQTYSNNFKTLIQINLGNEQYDPYDELEDGLIALYGLIQLEKENGQDSELVQTSLTNTIFYILSALLVNLDQSMLEENVIARRLIHVFILVLQQYPDKLAMLSEQHLDFVLRSILLTTQRYPFYANSYLN
ncbi:hypothetical protein K502DRAFT_338810 [Neoconidiobolus thromboides FSU 785]|nr:hypothetical protein K502DRAFT_338810 [Neoconidiobolus thromboides FSU 785]